MSPMIRGNAVELILAGFFLLQLLLLAYRKNWLTGSGFAGAFGIGAALIALGELDFLLLLVFFFVSSSLVSRLGEKKKLSLASGIIEKGGSRDFGQVMSNGGIALLCAILYRFHPSARFYGAYLGSLAAAMADTWETEIGLLSGSAPRSIFSWKRVNPGTSGGVSFQGFIGGLIGCGLLGLAAALLHAPDGAVSSALVAGMGGSIIDSLAGGSLQALYSCPACGTETEAPLHECGTKATLVRGLSFVNNDRVNLLCTLFGACLGWLVI